MNFEKLKDAARKYEQKEDWRRAIEVYQKAIQEFESGQDPNPDLSIYNRVGDLYMKAYEPSNAVQAYERAVDLYGDQGFLNNAIALCGKVLRVNPGRIQTYLKLAYLHARKNVVIEAKRNLIEYLERMHTANQLDEAFKALYAFADTFPHNQEIREMLTELSRAGLRSPDMKARLEGLGAHLEAGQAPRPSRVQTNIHGEVIESGRGNDLVFLDIGGEVEPPLVIPPSASRATVPMATPEQAPESTADESIWEEKDLDPGAAEGGEVDGLVVIGGNDDIEHEERGDGDGLLLADVVIDEPEPLEIEPTSQGDAEVMADDVEPPEGLELETTSEADLDLDAPLASEPDLVILPDADDLESVDDVEGLEVFRGEYVGADDDAPAGEPEPAEESLEVTDDLAGAGITFESSDRYLEDDEAIPETELLEASDAEDIVWDTDLLEEQAGVVTDAIEDPRPAEPSLEELEDRVLDDPENADAHRALGEALIARGDTVRGMDELDLALMACENRDEWSRAFDLVNELIRLDPASVRYYQKRVEVAYRTGEKGRLIDSYLELGDALVRTGAMEKAIAVYHRVLEHEPANDRASTALEVLAPRPSAEEQPPPAVPRGEPDSAAPAPSDMEGPPAPQPAAPASPASEAFVDLAALVTDDTPRADTRMRVEDEEPTGDEERDFAELLQQFKRGIDENVAAEDFQSHYDLGVAFKEMGLLDEAIAEFQKALRAPEVRLRTSEALGVCFYEKEQPAIAEAILRRAVEDQPGADDQKVGLLYWLGRTLEIQERPGEALGCYQRVMAVDIRFGDTGDRMRQLDAGRHA